MKYFIANHKNYMNKSDAKKFARAMKKFDNPTDNIVVVSPSFLYFSYYDNSNVNICAQNFNTLNPLSGGISLDQIKSFDLKYTIVGHSDSRWKLLESDESISEKVSCLLENDITPILCFGEKEEVPVENAIEYLIHQLDDSLMKVSTDMVDKIIFAYEPVWSISNGKKYSKVLDPDTLDVIISSIKESFKERFGKNIKILYGGSVNTINVVELNKISSIDGYLIGKSSLNYDDFITLIKSTL